MEDNLWIVMIRCNFDDVPLYATNDIVHAHSTAEAHTLDDCYEYINDHLEILKQGDVTQPLYLDIYHMQDGNLVGVERIHDFVHEPKAET